ncbi:serine/threonine-protein phosphatase 6 regulatory ankyrin repeat subunit C-like isoform X2 [Stegodyphus dumicola]|uniref:serine/threonine-protein phosphatase 6 regulatory ankyrin repeat subunit C-like isoform X2 n=1 Tax=Stegodyphus dumicola TaxID=202533 RepID=UPI0015AB9A00|nr:serine/threonine-protein phosphatase 6 regulatory ankyrin repeat subunit C-like isoform X2 [Stegodyphus dumicola]
MDTKALRLAVLKAAIGETESIKCYLKQGSYADYIFPSVKHGRVRPPALHLSSGLNFLMRGSFLYPSGWLFDCEDALCNILLHLAAIVSDCELTRLLLEKGADVTSIHGIGGTALHTACMRDSLEIVKLIAEKSPASILEARDHRNETPLEIACSSGSPEVVQFLLSMGCSVVVKDRRCGGPLLSAIFNNPIYATPIASLLLDAGADINHVHAYLGTPLMVAVLQSALKMRPAKDPTTYEDFSDENFLLEIKREHFGMLSMASAIQHVLRPAEDPITDQNFPYIDFCTLLIDRGCDVNATDIIYGTTALNVAVRLNHEILVRKLLISGSDIDRRDNRGCSPLYYACLQGSQRIVDLFITFGANLRTQDWEATFELWKLMKKLNEKNTQLLNYVIYQSKQCLTLENLCSKIIRKNTRNVEKNAINLGIPSILVNRLLLKG